MNGTVTSLRKASSNHFVHLVGWVISVIDVLARSSGFTYTLQLPSRGDGYGAADKDMRHGTQANYSRIGRGWSNDNDDATPSLMFAGAYVTTSRLNWTKVGVGV